jgi:hypothetical protein
VRRVLIGLGLLLLLAGLFWPLLAKLPLCRLPGDIVIDRPGFKVFAPITTMIIVSLVISFLLWLWRK